MIHVTMYSVTTNHITLIVAATAHHSHYFLTARPNAFRNGRKITEGAPLRPSSACRAVPIATPVTRSAAQRSPPLSHSCSRPKRPRVTSGSRHDPPQVPREPARPAGGAPPPGRAPAGPCEEAHLLHESRSPRGGTAGQKPTGFANRSRRSRDVTPSTARRPGDGRSRRGGAGCREGAPANGGRGGGRGRAGRAERRGGGQWGAGWEAWPRRLGFRVERVRGLGCKVCSPGASGGSGGGRAGGGGDGAALAVGAPPRAARRLSSRPGRAGPAAAGARPGAMCGGMAAEGPGGPRWWQNRRARLLCMLALTFLFFVVEVVVSRVTSSLAMLSDSFHMLSDVMALVVALVAVRFAQRTRATKKNTFGWVRAEVMGALVNAVFLTALCFTILLEAIERFTEPHEIQQPLVVIAVGVAGLVINLLGLCLFNHHGVGGHGHSHGHAHGGGARLPRGSAKAEQSPGDGEAALHREETSTLVENCSGSNGVSQEKLGKPRAPRARRGRAPQVPSSRTAVARAPRGRPSVLREAAGKLLSGAGGTSASNLLSGC